MVIWILDLFNSTYHICSKFPYELVLTILLLALTSLALIGCISASIAEGQAPYSHAPYISEKTKIVYPGHYSSVLTFCNDGDGIISGGYSIDSAVELTIFDTMVHSNRPVQEINKTGYFEGWQAGLVNKGNESTEITAICLCLNLTLTP